jgi:hypothetical protein
MDVETLSRLFRHLGNDKLKFSYAIPTKGNQQGEVRVKTLADHW